MGELSRQERERRRHKRLMLEAAEELFSRQGYHSTTMKEIARAAEFSVGALYNMFEGKQALYLELINLRCSQYYELVFEKLDSLENPVDQLRAVVDTKMDFFREQHRKFFRIFRNLVTQDKPLATPSMSEEWRRGYESYLERLGEVVRNGIDQGEFVDKPAPLLVVSLEGVTNAIIASWVRGTDEQLEGISSEDVGGVILHGVMKENSSYV
mgnify:CR=1 FL=1